MNLNCLTYNQLQAYSEHTLNTSESEQLYKHISVCELCACAVNGFSAIPFSSDELVAIHREIDGKVNATAVNSLTFAQVFIMLFSVLSIFGVYSISNHTQVDGEFEKKSIKTELTILVPHKYETENSSRKEISAVTKAFKKVINAIEYKKFERCITPIEALVPINVSNHIDESSSSTSEELLTPRTNENVIYIYDLKVTDYNKLYFGRSTDESNLFKTHVPVFKENRESKEDDFSIVEHVEPADRVLKDGLASFNKQQFGNALENFNLLIENNPKDVNAKFYAALSYYNLNRIEKCMLNLKSVMESPNKSFYPEAQWYMALLTIKNGDILSGRKQLEVIVSEKGFYAKRAKEKLKNL